MPSVLRFLLRCSTFDCIVSFHNVTVQTHYLLLYSSLDHEFEAARSVSRLRGLLFRKPEVSHCVGVIVAPLVSISSIGRRASEM